MSQCLRPKSARYRELLTDALEKMCKRHRGYQRNVAVPCQLAGEHHALSAASEHANTPHTSLTTCKLTNMYNSAENASACCCIAQGLFCTRPPWHLAGYSNVSSTAPDLRTWRSVWSPRQCKVFWSRTTDMLSTGRFDSENGHTDDRRKWHTQARFHAQRIVRSFQGSPATYGCIMF